MKENQNSDSKIIFDLPAPSKQQQKAIYYSSQESDYETIVLACGRRAGKSHAIKYILLMWLSQGENKRVWYVNYTDNQTKEFFYSFYTAIKDSGLVKKIRQDKGNSIIYFTNGNVLECKSSKSGDSLRGGDGIDALVVDEFAYVKEEVYQQIILPQLATVRTPGLKKKIVLASSKRGKANHLFKVYSRGLNNHLPENRKVISLEWNIYDNPNIDAEFINNARHSMSPAQFSQEILNEWVESAGVFNNIKECALIEANQNYDSSRSYFLGIDVGLRTDNTCLSIVSSKPGTNNKVMQLNAQYTFSNILSTDLEEHIVRLNKQWKFKKILIEQNSSGLPILTNLLIRHKLYNAEGFVTSWKSKGIIVNQLAHMFNAKEIEIINDDELISELDDFIIKETANGFNKYEGASGHDDRVMSLCIATECWHENRASGEYSIKVL